MPIGLRTGLIAFAIPLILVATNVRVWGQLTVDAPNSWPRPDCPPRCGDYAGLSDERSRSGLLANDSVAPRSRGEARYVPPDLGAPETRVSGGTR